MRSIVTVVALMLVSTTSLAKPGAGLAMGPKLDNHDAKLASGAGGTFGRSCGYCHGTNVGPVILGQGLPPEAIMATVRAGRGAMPAFRPTEISDPDLKALALWISTSPKAPGDHGK